MYRELLLARSPSQRLAMACEMFSTAKALVRAGIEQEHGPLEPEELRQRMFLRLYGQDFSEAEKEKICRALFK